MVMTGMGVRVGAAVGPGVGGAGAADGDSDEPRCPKQAHINPAEVAQPNVSNATHSGLDEYPGTPSIAFSALLLDVHGDEAPHGVPEMVPSALEPDHQKSTVRPASTNGRSRELEENICDHDGEIRIPVGPKTLADW